MKRFVFTPTIQHAITFAALAHGDQERKQGDIPYITHPLAVAMILATITEDQDIIVAGILHDVLEDTPYLPESIEDSFGIRVLRFVEAVTDEKRGINTWIERKRNSIKKILESGHEAILIKSADCIHNMTDTIIYLNGTIPTPLFKFPRFTKNGEDRLVRYKEIIVSFENSWPQNPLKSQLERAYTDLSRVWS